MFTGTFGIVSPENVVLHGVRRPSAELAPLAAMATLLCALYTAMILFPAADESTVDGVRTIRLNAWRGQTYLLMLGSAAVAVFLAIRTKHREGGRPQQPLLALGLSSPAFLCFGAFNDAGAFYDAGFVRGTDGREYHLLQSAFLQGAELAIGRLQRRVGPFEEYEALVSSPWEEGFGYLAVVRPEGSSEDRSIWLTADGKVVGVPHGNMAFLAYDLGEGKPYSQIYNGNPGGYTDMRALSPFLLLGTNDVPSQADFQTLLDPKGFGRPDAEALSQDFENRNPKVRSLARQLLSDLRAHPKEE